MRGLAGIRVKQPVKLRESGQRDQADPEAEHQPGGGDTDCRKAANALPSDLHDAAIKLLISHNASTIS